MKIIRHDNMVPINGSDTVPGGLYCLATDRTSVLLCIMFTSAEFKRYVDVRSGKVLDPGSSRTFFELDAALIIHGYAPVSPF